MAHRLVDSVVEPDLALRGQLEALVAGLTGDDAQVVLLGPGAPLTDIARLKDGGFAVLVLGDVTRRVAAIEAGADDAIDWPADAAELCLRAGRIAERVGTLDVERRDLEALLGLSEALTTTSDIEGTLHQIAKRLATIMLSERCSLILLGDEMKRAVVVADSEDATLRNQPIRIESYPEIDEVARTRKPLVIDDVDKAPLFDGIREMIRDKPIGNTALFPVSLNRRVQGVFMLRGADVRTEGLTDRQVRFATIVANATAIAIRNARMYRSIRERTERVLSGRIKAERRLRQLEKYQRFFDLAGDGLTIVDGRGQIVFANRAAQEILGFDAADLTRIRLLDVIADSSRAEAEELLAGFRHGRHRRRVDLDVVRANGDPAILSLSTASLDPEAAEGLADLPPGRWAEVAAIISMRDVTEPRRLQLELQETKEFLENVIESSADAIVAADISGKILIFNQGAEKITGLRSDDVIGQMNVEKLYPEGVAREIMIRLRSPKYGGLGKYEAGRHELVTKDGDHVPINLAAALIFDKDGPIASVGIFSDLRERIRMEEELANAQEQLEISERQAVVVELAGTAAHELSQPLTTILGSAELMQRRLPPTGPNRKSVDRILSECDRMVAMLRKIGQITKYETKPYLGTTKILDLDAATNSKDES